MSDNVGLSTPRGSGTSGYVQKNLAFLKPRDNIAPYPKDLDSLRHKQRQPDKGILEHERKREIEVKVLDLQDKLEDEEVDEEEIEKQCDALRAKLTAELERGAGKSGTGPKRTFKQGQVHEMADAKIKESERLRRALKISSNYEEGSHWRKQEERLKGSLDDEGSDDGKGKGRERDRDERRDRDRD